MTAPEYQMSSSVLQISKRSGPQAVFSSFADYSHPISIRTDRLRSYGPGRSKLRKFQAV
ncbi:MULTISPECIES: hypothetical protein [unclassified Bradyrhizobium]|uniref:hypothetical protein n=1 Tax=unclassified Bradyrhizobium TaxID=2631580 RepID=UPI0028EF79E3|nr:MULTISPECIES: hypothetical protein [unclassified Bradyrhizobium]